MKVIAISKFKATCLSLLDQVSKTGNPLLITKNGKPIAQILPPAKEESNKSWIGSGKGQLEIVGDILSPLPHEDWAVFKK